MRITNVQNFGRFLEIYGQENDSKLAQIIQSITSYTKNNRVRVSDVKMNTVYLSFDVSMKIFNRCMVTEIFDSSNVLIHLIDNGRQIELDTSLVSFCV